jgi:hypothetical protein
MHVLKGSWAIEETLAYMKSDQKIEQIIPNIW